MGRRRGAAGFSLTELIIAVALVAIVSALAVPQFQRYSANADLKAAAREVAGDFFNVRQQAIEGRVGQNPEYRITLDVSGNGYSLQSREMGATAWNTTWTKSLASFGNGIRIESTTFTGAVVSFQQRGTISPFGTIFLLNGRGSRATIRVSSMGRTNVTFEMR